MTSRYSGLAEARAIGLEPARAYLHQTHPPISPGRDGSGKVLQVLRHAPGQDIVLRLCTGGAWAACQPEGADLPVVWSGGCLPGRIGNVGGDHVIRKAEAFLDVRLHQRVLVGTQLGEERQTKTLKE